jgi:filamentous hemagglutinin
MSDTNPAKADAVTSQQRGQDYVNEQNTLTSTGLFTYGALATAGDAASSVADSVSRQPIGRLASLAAGQAIDLGYGIVNLGIQVLSHGPSAIPQSPPDFPGDSNGPTGSAGAVVTATLPLYLCAPPVCLMTPPIVTGTSGSKWTNLTFSSGQDSGSSGGSGDGASGANNGANPITSGGTANAVSGQGLRGQLASENLANIAAQDPRLAAAVKGSSTASPNFSIGTGTVAEADQLGQTWVGDGARLVGNQTACPGCLISADGTRIYRPPQPKTSSFATTGVQANFVQQTSTGTVISNGHLNVTP